MDRVWSWWLVAGLSAAYLAAFPALYARLGDATLALSMLPMVIAAWWAGARGSVVAGVVMVGVNLVLLQTIGGQAGFRPAQIPRIAVALVMAASAGWAGEVTRRQRKLLEQNRRLTDELRANQLALEQTVEERTAELLRTNASLVAETTARRDADARAAAADRLAVIGTLTAGIGHEINNPLAAVSANLEFIEESLPSMPPVVAEALGDARSAARRAGEIVRHMRVFIQSNVSSEKAEVRWVVESTVRVVAHQIRHRARLDVDVEGDLAVALAPAHLGQILLNLLVNAAQALDERPADRNFVRVRARGAPEANQVTIEVTDSGTGISPGAQERIFDPFFSTKPDRGTGLGLWICQQIVGGAGGSISVESIAGEGTTFRVVLPAGSHADEELIGAAHPKLARRIRLLVIDDDPQVGRAIDRLMAGRHELVVRQDPRRALHELEAGQRFDVILCDVMMPTLNGVDFFAHLQRIDPDQADRVIFMTGGAFVERANEFIHDRKRRLIEKPFEAEILESAIREVLEPAARPIVH